MPVSPVLRPYIQYYVSGFFTLEKPEIPDFTLLPNNSLAILLFLDDCYLTTGHSRTGLTMSCCLTGLFGTNNLPVVNVLAFKKSIRWINIVLTPAGLTRLLGIQAGEITNMFVDMDNMFPEFTGRLRLFLNTFHGECSQKELLDRFFANRFQRKQFKPDKRLTILFDYLDLADRGCSIDELAEQLNVSYRTLERLFINKVGLPVKEYFKIHRIKKILKCLHNSACFHYPDLVESGGYYDQSQLIREFKKMTGLTPKQFAEATAGKFYLDRPFLTVI